MAKILNINKNDAHDRLTFVKQRDSISIQTNIEDMISKDPFEGRAFYVFAHRRTGEDGAADRLIWQPRLLKPKAQTNSMLFKVHPKKPEEVRIIWMIPPREQFSAYKKGKLFEHDIVVWSIHMFDHNRKALEEKEDEDPTEEQAACIYRQLYPNLFKEKEL